MKVFGWITIVALVLLAVFTIANWSYHHHAMIGAVTTVATTDDRSSLLTRSFRPSSRFFSSRRLSEALTMRPAMPITLS